MANAPTDKPWPLAGKAALVFWIKAQNQNIPGWQGPNPVVTLIGSDGKRLKLTPKEDVLANPGYNEARDGWAHVVVPLKEDPAWERAGELPDAAKVISIGFDSWGNSPLKIWVDGMGLREAKVK